MLDAKLRWTGNSCGVVLPKEALAHLRVAEGDRLFLIEMPDRGDRVTPYDPEFKRQLRLAEEGMARYRSTLRALAK